MHFLSLFRGVKMDLHLFAEMSLVVPLRFEGTIEPRRRTVERVGRAEGRVELVERPVDRKMELLAKVQIDPFRRVEEDRERTLPLPLRPFRLHDLHSDPLCDGREEGDDLFDGSQFHDLSVKELRAACRSQSYVLD